MKHLAALLLGMIATHALAGEPRTEIVIFAQPGATAEGVWSGVHALPPCHAVMLRAGGGAEAAFTPGDARCQPQPGMDVVVSGMNVAEPSTLVAAAGKLRGNGYRVLMHQAWRQAGTGRSPVLIRQGDIEGIVALGGTPRAPEVTLTLTLQRASGEKTEYVTLQETRVLKPGEPNYFDHSLLGALVQVNDTP